MKVPWNENRKKKTAGQASEERGARVLGGRLQTNSGRFWFSKRDFKALGLLVENRYTENKSISVKHQELKKITREAIHEDSLPAMRLDFAGDAWLLIPEKHIEVIDG
jgi:hypothetical protein